MVVLCLNCSDFERNFSSEHGVRNLAHALPQFFQNGGTLGYFMIIANGAIVGLMVRIDFSRGVWKAPAGTEAHLRGIGGLEY